MKCRVNLAYTEVSTFNGVAKPI